MTRAADVQAERRQGISQIRRLQLCNASLSRRLPVGGRGAGHYGAERCRAMAAPDDQDMDMAWRRPRSGAGALSRLRIKSR